MSNRRLQTLVGIMAVLAVVRWLVPNAATDESSAQDGMKSRPTSASKANVPRVEKPSAALETRPQTSSDFREDDRPGNAFTVRTPPVISAPAAAAVLVQAPQIVPTAPAASTLPSQRTTAPSPFQVIGTWDDGGPSAVFVSSPSGTLLARVGVTLMTDYKVVAVLPQQVTLHQISTNLDIQLPVPVRNSK